MVARRRILYVTSGNVPGWGREAMHATVAARALARWWDLDILCPMIGRTGHVASFHGSRLLRVPLPDVSTGGAEAFARAVRRQLADGAYEAVHARSCIEAGPVLEARAGGDFIFVYDPAPPTDLMQHLGLEGMERQAEVLAALEREAMRTSELVISRDAAMLGRILGCRPSEKGIFSSVHPVDLDVFDALPCAVGSEPVVLLMGEPGWPMTKDSGLDLRRLGEQWGPGRWSPETPDDLALALCGADLCVAVPPLAREPWSSQMPHGLLEAAACGRPIVAPRVPCVEEVLGPEAGPLLYEPRGAAPLRDAIRHALGAPQTAMLAASAIRQRVRSLNAASGVRAALASLYASIVPPSGDVPVWPAAPALPGRH